MRRAVEQAAVEKLLDLGALDSAIARAKGRRGMRALKLILAAWRSEDRRVPNLRSLLEAGMFPVLVEAGLPLPECNVKLQIDGHRFAVDLLWKAQLLVIETDGEETHGTRVAFQRDRWRDQVLTAAGYRVARVTWRQLEDEPDAIASRIRRMLEPYVESSARAVP
jgi:very-short-patch-repair endonuclease